MIWIFFIIDIIYLNGIEMRELQPPNLSQVIQLKEILVYINSTKSFIYFTSFILTITERKKIKSEISNSIYRVVDCDLTEEINRSIMNQCIHPDDFSLEKRHSTLVLQKQNTKKENDELIGSLEETNNINKPLLN